jgi:hypothetical protein
VPTLLLLPEFGADAVVSGGFGRSEMAKSPSNHALGRVWPKMACELLFDH